MKRFSARKLHKYIGIPLCILLFFASLSGILLNHRDLLRKIDVPRAMMPESYSFDNWNNASVRGAVMHQGQYYIYGNAGIWVTDSTLTTKAAASREGFAHGADELKVVAMTADVKDNLWAASQYRLYLLDRGRWQQCALPRGLRERITDLCTRGDSLIMMSRSYVYVSKLSHGASPDRLSWEKKELLKPDDYTGRMLLFQLVWMLHSGEYFGTPGQLIVDILGVVMMVLCVTGILFTIRSHKLKKRGKVMQPERRKSLTGKLKSNLKWHNLLGAKIFYLLLFVTVTGWMLRPPMMLPLIFAKAKPWKISHLYSDNAWNDRLRALRYDEHRGEWLMSTAEGFYVMKTLDSKPKRWTMQPPMSPMGINVFEQTADGKWLIGSFTGLYIIDPTLQGHGEGVVDYFTGKAAVPMRGRPVGNHLISGIIRHTARPDIIFLYDRGACVKGAATVGSKADCSVAAFVPQPATLIATPYSLWQFALELHTGRLYKPFIGNLGVDLFVFVLGLTSIIVLYTGYKRRPRKKKDRD
ncbi:PepSY-associated TM helix domain-containing protein [Porphyromonas pogonae]|uniref:PepSY-associated TM helix domain-containing protein n=1 Tax=Porphyromonas pogonae TaxID=867595 RepID=UPI002E783D3F|nr:PepSY-associated TM helix domain-containing protein [Porphyromonas pogonae]